MATPWRPTEDLRRYTESQEMRVLEDISDAGRTRRKAEREGFQHPTACIHDLKPDAVLVTRLSRFMRNARETLNAVYEMRKLDVG